MGGGCGEKPAPKSQVQAGEERERERDLLETAKLMLVKTLRLCHQHISMQASVGLGQNM